MKKYFDFGIMRVAFDILPNLCIRWFRNGHGKLKFDLHISWLCFFVRTRNFPKCLMADMEEQRRTIRGTEK